MTRVDSTGAETPIVQVAVPYRSLVFQRRHGRFHAAIRVSAVAVLNGRRVGGGVGNAEAEVPDYAASSAEGQVVCAVPLRLRARGRLQLTVSVSVVGTSRRWRERLEYAAGEGSRVPLYFADFRWNLEGGGDASAVLGVTQDTLRVRVSLGRRPNVAQWPAGGVALLGAIVPSEKSERPPPERWELRPTAVGEAVAPVDLAWAAGDLPFGRLRLALWLESGAEGSGDRLDLDPPRPFMNLCLRWQDDTEWRQQVAWLEGVVDREGRQRLARVARDQRRAAWRAVWDDAGARAGVTSAELEREHLVRITEADERFGGFGRGALSDRGRIWVRYGRPDSIEERGDNLSYEGRWEIWYYHEERLVFTFFDAHGLGDYRLAGSGSL